MAALIFVLSGVKINVQQYINDILKTELLPWPNELLSRRTLEPPAGLCITPQLQTNTNWIEKKMFRRLQARVYGPQEAPISTFELFGLVHFRDESLENSSCFVRCPESKAVPGMGFDFLRTVACHV